ncbi:MAG TPA: Wzz/FepE/Etk N-terminal domain-containing protein [Solirubrobacteraceae bacterium]|nr:Wzz/FepE/Etk N-terminal domain-containing protein [Solirubrobacteraceae bacterium]
MSETTDASAIFAPLWRHRWLILLVGALVAVGSYVHYKRQPSVYQATTQIYLANGSEEQSLLTDAQGRKALNERAVSDQAAIVNSNVVSKAVRNLLRGEHAHAALKGKARAKATAGSDLVVITAEAVNAKAAAKLANAYASVYIKRQHATYVKEIGAAIAATRGALRRVEAQASAQKTAARGRSSAAISGSAALQAATLASRINQLESALRVTRVAQISPAGPKKAHLLSPTPKRNAIFGFLLGLLMASTAAYALGRLDRRLRSLAAIEEAFGTKALAALPKVKRPIVHEDGQPRVCPGLLEPLRRAHTALRLGGVARDRAQAPRVLLVLSADAADGRSTFLAALALARRDAGERVTLVEADFRRPVQGKLLDVTAPWGLAQVLEGQITADEAMRLVVSPSAQPLTQQPATGESGGGGVSTLVQTRSGTGAASVLVCGGPSANPPALLASAATGELLGALAQEYDSVLIDVPSPLEVSDAMALLHLVDGIVIVARVGHTRRASAERLMELLERSPSAPVLGVVANGVATGELSRMGFSPQHGAKGRLRALLRR